MLTGSSSLAMPKQRPTKRAQRRQEVRENYLGGRARGPYRHTPTLNKSFEEEREAQAGASTSRSTTHNEEAGPSQSTGASSTSRDSRDSDVCCKCYPVLSRYKETFQGLVHQGSELKRRKHTNPYPKRSDMQHYRDMNAQNAWLRNHMFDGLGNYLFCARCIRATFRVSPQRLSRQRAVKRAQSESPTRELTKTEVEQQNLGAYVLMPQGCDQSFMKWWRSLPPTTNVTVRYPHERHGNCGRVSNSAKTSVMNDFLTFVDQNSQPNGRSADSYGPTHYFLSKFTTIQTPKQGVCNYSERAQRSVVAEFNRAQRMAGKEGCSNASASNWLHKQRPKVAICPHKQDYCDFCAKNNASIHAKRTTLNRIRQSGSASTEDQKKLEDDIAALERELEEHRTKARLSHEKYIEITKQCSEQLEKIKALEQTQQSDEEREELARLKERFTLVISVDYQMSKLVPSWGYSPQPGSTYYLQKLSHDVFGIVNHAENKSTIYIFDERTGPKTTDHTVSYITDYLRGSIQVPSWVRKVHIFMDNTCSTNKNYYTMGWANEIVQQGYFDVLRISFLLAGHTKFAPDLLFSKVAQTFSKSDVFTTSELAEVAGQYADVVVDEGERVYKWRSSLVKYSSLPGIRDLHDFIFARNPGMDVRLRVRPLCYTGAIRPTQFHVKRGYTLAESAIPTASLSYRNSGEGRPLTDVKLSHLRQMYDNFISPERHLPIV